MIRKIATGGLIAAAALAAPYAFTADPPGARLEATFEKADKDNDGTMTKDEAKSMPRVAKNFDATDADKDGTVSEKEIHDYMKARRPKK